MLVAALALCVCAWLGVLVAPPQPHRVRERLEPDVTEPADLEAVTVLIPARDEVDVIAGTLAALTSQGEGLTVVLIDDQSIDGTAATAQKAAGQALDLRIVQGLELPPGWAGKLWALEQGLGAVEREFVLLLDADIVLAPGMIATLLASAKRRNAGLVSIMAELSCAGFWERLLAPAFVFFFKLLYPFAWSNDAKRRTAAAAGGCMLVRTNVLRAIGGFSAIRSALIDDCTLAAAIKRHGWPIWLGLSYGVRSVRRYPTLGGFWQMVSRSAFTQLRYSGWLLLATTLAMAVVILAPALALAIGALDSDGRLFLLGMVGWAAMALSYWPVVNFYRLAPAWALSLPVSSMLFLAMTWTSALAYWFGSGASWKRRRYDRSSSNRDS